MCSVDDIIFGWWSADCFYVTVGDGTVWWFSGANLHNFSSVCFVGIVIFVSRFRVVIVFCVIVRRSVR